MSTYAGASLIYYPSGYKAGTAYSLKPTDGSGDLTFTRASSATRVNSDGLIESPRTNLVLYSEQFDNATWVKDFSSVTANTTTSPDGTTNADTYTGNGGANVKFIYQANSVTSGTTYSISVYAKKNTNNFLQINTATTPFGVNAWANFNLDSGVVGTVGSSATASIQNVGNGWYRCVITAPAVATGAYASALFTLITSATSVRAEFNTLSTSVFLWGAQLEQGSTATDYIPTTTSARTTFAGITQDGTSASNIPRINYTGGGCGKLLLEPQRTNLVAYSNDFSQWNITNLTITANNVTSPEGTLNASKIEMTGNGSIRNANEITFNNAYSYSIFVKKGNSRYITLRSAFFTQSIIVVFDLDTLTAQTDGKIENYGNDWYRLSISKNISSDADKSGFFYLYLPDSLANPTTSVSGNYAYFYGGQIEDGSYPTSYIPTTTTAVTRVAESTSRSGLGLTNSTFVLNFQILSYVAELFDFTKTGGGRMFYIAVQSNGFVTFNSVSGGSIGAIGTPLAINTSHKIAFTLNASTSNVSVFINGVKIGTYATDITTFGAFSGLQTFGYAPASKVEQILIFPSVLTDAQCIELTTL